MFEDSTFESTGAIRTRSRKWMLATFALNGSILLALVLIPLLYPEALPRLDISMLMTVPPPLDEPKPQPAPAHATLVRPQVQGTFLQAPSVIPKTVYIGEGPEVVQNIPLGDSMGMGAASPDNPFNGHGSPVVVVAPPKKRVQLASSIVEGLALYKPAPPYPEIAKATRTAGTVVLQATIAKNGTIENLRVVSGPVLLQQAALNAVQQWRYRPYLLNSQPVEVETTVNVVFRLD